MEKNDLLDVYFFLIFSTDNLHSRAKILNKSISDLSQSLANLLLELSVNPELKEEEINQSIKALHYMELEIIQHINIFIELLAVYYHYIRTDIRALPQAIGREEDNFLSSEYEFIEKQNRNTIQEVFKYPDAEKFDELTVSEKAELSRGLTESTIVIENLFKNILKFKGNFKQIYDKYKHVMAEVTGAYALHKKEGALESRFYVRHKTNDKNYKIYTIPLSKEIIEYFQSVSRDVLNLFEVLLDNQLLHLSNEGKSFIPRHLFFREEETGKRINQIISKIRSCIMPNYTAVLEINKAPLEGQQKMADAFRKNCVYVMKKDIYDKEALKKARIR